MHNLSFVGEHIMALTKLVQGTHPVLLMIKYLLVLLNNFHKRKLLLSVAIYSGVLPSLYSYVHHSLLGPRHSEGATQFPCLCA